MTASAPIGADPTAELDVVSGIELGRRAYRRKQTGKSVVIALLSTLIFAAVIALILRNSPGWQVTRETFFAPEHFRASLPKVLAALWLNVKVLFFAVIGVAIFATLLAFLRTLRGPVFFPLRFVAAAYTDLFRGVPFLIVLYLVGFGVPALGLTDSVIPYSVLGTIALVLTYSSYVAEVLRAGLEAVHPSQRFAARSLGLSHGQALRLIVLPQAVRKVTPALMNDFVSMQKDVGLISVLGAVDAIRAAQIYQATTYNFTSYVVAGLLFVCLSWPFIRLTDWYTARQQRREQVGGVV
ncbi:amino acid ABC transporter permease [Rarobacter faecitabidus]|uniref:Amino acid ABC transporter membrane protein (PAAT family) n=1 Tax=Rarobacter faecitabidus TaxID=13243 RepID=A0A542ZPC0_RARFA|nr:amino acid ABC transporter permease [Rarobacter faecitabidus]TQL62167.1 amino acid ABC transporter membrane protein (PAAT family) [Rarobacter faecitabidus]